MIIHDMPQGSPEWFRVRIGIPTASQAHRIVTPTGKLSKSSRTYAFRLVAETLLGHSLEAQEETEWMERGRMLESEAVGLYEFHTDVETRKVGFVTTDSGRIGASPDRLLIGQNGAVEIKCPAPQTHIGYMIDGFGLDYIPQVQCQMLVGEFDFVDRVAYHPELPPVIQRTYRDAEYIATLGAALTEFADMLERMLERVRASGYFAERAAVDA